MQLSDEQIVNDVTPQGFKFNIKLDTLHGNSAYSDEPLMTSPLGSFHGSCKSKEHDDNDVKGTAENINVLVTLRTSLHSSVNCETKEDDESIESNSQTQDEAKSEDIEQNVTKKENIPQEHIPCSNRRKSCLVVRTQEESLSTSVISTSSNREHSVSFSKLQIREYEIQLVNNPACTGGPPIGIGWKFEEKEDVDLIEMQDKEKKYIKLDDKPPGPYDQIYIKPHDRLTMLKKNGYTDAEIVECILDVKDAQKVRRTSAIASDKDEMKMEMVNKVTKKLKKLIRTKEQKKHDRMCKLFCQQ